MMIIEAMQGLPLAGGSIVLGTAEFLIDQPIIIDRDGIELRGTGPNTVLKLADKANCSVVIIGSMTTPVSRTMKDVFSPLSHH